MGRLFLPLVRTARKLVRGLMLTSAGALWGAACSGSGAPPMSSRSRAPDLVGTRRSDPVPRATSSHRSQRLRLQTGPVLPEGLLGTAHPLVLEAASPDGSWVVICQARSDTDGDAMIEVRVGPHGRLEGDRLESYLVRREGPGLPIDALLAFDPTGRWLVVQRSGAGLLMDASSEEVINLSTLGADLVPDALEFEPHRTLSFDARGERLLYVRRESGRVEVVVRELGSGRETTIDPGPGELWRAALDPTGLWVILQMINEDTDGNGRLEWPVPKLETGGGHCIGPIPRFSVWPTRADRPRTRFAPSQGGQVRELAGLVAPLGHELLWRTAAGSLMLGRPGGGTQELAPADCGARVLHADPERELVLAVCTNTRNPPLLKLLARGLRMELPVELAPPPSDAPVGSTPRLVALYPGQDVLLVDLEQRRAERLESRDRIVVSDGPRAVLWRQQALWLLDVDRGTLTRLVDLRPGLVEWKAQGAVAAVGGWVVDARKGKLVGKFSGRAMAVTRSGSVLVCVGREQDASRLAVGPLRWVSPHDPSVPQPE